jgi:phenylalanyl-tRNA synthetase beta chain
VPSWRRDVDGEHDLVEDVLRIKGYDSIPTLSLPRIASTRPAFSIEQRRARSVRRSLASRGLFETTTWSFMAHSQAALFVSASNIHSLENPLSAELDVLRPSLLPNLIAAVGRNAVRAMPNVSLFEIGPRFEGDAPGEQTLIAGGVRAGDAISRHWTESRRDVDVLDAKADALAALAAAGVQIERVQIGRSDKAAAPSWYHPGQSGTICLGPNVLAEFGAVHPNVLKQMDVNGPLVGFEVFLDRVPIPKKSGGPARPKFTPSHYQPVERDFAFVVADSVGADDVLRAIRGVDKDLITAITLFDVYTGDNVDAGNKSLALSVRFEPRDATLTDTDIESLSQRIISAVEKAVGGQLRV